MWFAVVSSLSAWVYKSVGVSPRDLGLSSSSILAQTTVGLLVCGIIGLVIGSVVGGLWGAWGATHDLELRQFADQMPLPFVSDDTVSNAAAAARPAVRLDLNDRIAVHDY